LVVKRLFVTFPIYSMRENNSKKASTQGRSCQNSLSSIASSLKLEQDLLFATGRWFLHFSYTFTHNQQDHTESTSTGLKFPIRINS
jgi:hypothetical protein